MKNTKIYESFLRLRNDFSKMTWKGRIDHIWTYYKETILIGLLFIIIAVGVLSSMLSKPKELLMGGVLVNVQITDDGFQYIESDYLSALGGDPQSQEVYILTTDIYSPDDSANLASSYQTLSKTMAMIAAQELDYFIMDQCALEIYLAQKAFLDLNDVFTTSELNDMSDLLIYTFTADEVGAGSDGQVPVAIRINDLPFAQAFMEDKEPIYVAFISNGPNKDRYRSLWDHLLAWKKET